ncbi:DNA polymerase III subunit gamma/tau [Brevibacillus sp. NRS-1366]|uniref:DNA polymerase III subunit gamma/tau n=1 Tax=Brevibacillus sp. NRS-1366 TaxID=3233899 RepID=UPI003D20CA79
MRKKELLFGFGAGLLVATSLLGGLDLRQTESRPMTTKEQIKKSAEEMQMVVLTPKEYEQWQQEKKVNLKPPPSVPKAPQTPSVGQTSAPQAKTPQAPQVEKTAQPEALFADDHLAASKQPAPQSVNGTESPTQALTPTAPVVEVPVAQKTVSFTVPYKATAEEVARILVEEGILPADNKFVDQLRSQNKLNRIRVGTYQVSDSASEAEIAKLITTPPKK